MTENHEFKVWKTIRLGNFPNDNALDQAIRRQGKQRSGMARFMMNSFPFRINQPMELDLSLVDIVADLGLTLTASKQAICDSAVRMGLQLCPAEAGPQLCLQTTDESDQQLIVASEALGKKSRLFMLNGRDLDAYEIDTLMPTTLWVFVLPR